MSGCLTTTTARDLSLANEMIEDLRDKIVELEKDIDPTLLEPTEWLVDMKGDLVEFQDAYKKNVEEFTACYIKHNSLIQILDNKEE